MMKTHKYLSHAAHEQDEDSDEDAPACPSSAHASRELLGGEISADTFDAESYLLATTNLISSVSQMCSPVRLLTVLHAALVA